MKRRELRLVSRYRKKIADQLDAGIKLGSLVADISGKAAKAVVDGHTFDLV